MGLGKSVAITVTVTLQGTVPKSWTEDDVAEKVAESLTWDFKSTKRSVVIEEEVDSTVEVEIEDEDDE